MIDVIDKECSAQKLLLCTSYFLSYCPLLIFMFLLAISSKLYCLQGDKSYSGSSSLTCKKAIQLDYERLVFLLWFVLVKQCSKGYLRFSSSRSAENLLCDLYSVIITKNQNQKRKYIYLKKKKRWKFINDIVEIHLYRFTSSAVLANFLNCASWIYRA
jgi:hypothetical protein